MTLESFDYNAYVQLVSRLKQTHTNVVFSDLADGDVGEPFYILRHDVDFSPEAALAMAELEANLGVRGSYFLLVSSDLYNLHSAAHCRVPMRLRELGHEVGLHYDVNAYELRGDVHAAFRSELEALTALANSPIRAIALHNPSVSGPDPFEWEPGLVNAYTVIGSRGLTYMSDSGGAWRSGTLALLEGGALPPRIQMLVHPFFWAREAGDRWERLREFVEARQHRRQSWADGIRELWSQHEGVRQDDERRRRAERIAAGAEHRY